MSKLASELPNVEFGPAPRKGPRGACYAIYKDCDSEDLAEVNKLRDKGLSWEQIQAEVDKILDVTEPIPYKKFIYHWSHKCKCWEDNR